MWPRPRGPRRGRWPRRRLLNDKFVVPHLCSRVDEKLAAACSGEENDELAAVAMQTKFAMIVFFGLPDPLVP